MPLSFQQESNLTSHSQLDKLGKTEVDRGKKRETLTGKSSPTLTEQPLCRKMQRREGKRRALLGKPWGLRRRPAKGAWLHLHRNRTAWLMLLKLRVFLVGGFFVGFFFLPRWVFSPTKSWRKVGYKSLCIFGQSGEGESQVKKKKIIAKNSQDKEHCIYTWSIKIATEAILTVWVWMRIHSVEALSKPECLLFFKKGIVISQASQKYEGIKINQWTWKKTQYKLYKNDRLTKEQSWEPRKIYSKLGK